VRAEAISSMKNDAADGKAHPMTLKKELARTIVADFHTAEAANKAAEDWARQFQKDQAPEALETVSISFAEVANREGDGVRLAKVLVKIGFTASTTEADRKIKEGAVSVDGARVSTPIVKASAATSLVIRLGRKIKKVTFATS
jgi:tyrosyl-tRNA synthetase